MTIASVAADDPVTASTMNQLIANVNSSPGIAIFTSNGTWAVPSGVHKFRVTLCGGGGGIGDIGVGGGGEDVFSIPGSDGGDSIARRIYVSGADIGTTYSITIGAGGGAIANGGPTSFGTLLTVAGGSCGATPVKGAPGNPTGGTLISQALAVGNQSVALFDTPGNVMRGYGEGAINGATSGAPGIVIIEW
jgi:hypothetical protein